MTGGTVVVIGSIGRNFAAGMSGGIAYLLGDAADLEARINPAMVALRPMTDADHAVVRALLEQHVALTGSDVARGLLLGWDATPPTFTKVMPLEYERALDREERRRLATLEPPVSSRVVAAE
jgi:glutamate synthase (NADPH/NADH) large chain